MSVLDKFLNAIRLNDDYDEDDEFFDDEDDIDEDDYEEEPKAKKRFFQKMKNQDEEEPRAAKKAPRTLRLPRPLPPPRRRDSPGFPHPVPKLPPCAEKLRRRYGSLRNQTQFHGRHP